MTGYQPIEILLIEDNVDEAELTMRSLKKNKLVNYLKHIDDGEEAIDFIFCNGKYSGRDESINPRLIILDLKLPKMDGLMILKRLKENASTNSIPVVVLTSSQEDSDVEESYKLGANSYIVKPVNFESFTEVVSGLACYWMLLNENV